MFFDLTAWADVELEPFYAFDVSVPAAGFGFDASRYRTAYVEGLRGIHRYWQGIEACEVEDLDDCRFKRRIDFGNGVKLCDCVEVTDDAIVQWIVQPDGTLYGRHETRIVPQADGGIVVRFTCALIPGTRGETAEIEAVRERIYRDKDEHFALSVAQALGERALSAKELA